MRIMTAHRITKEELRRCPVPMVMGFMGDEGTMHSVGIEPDEFADPKYGTGLGGAIVTKLEQQLNARKPRNI